MSTDASSSASLARQGGRLGTVTLWLFGFLLAYVLSLGPAVTLADHGVIGLDKLEPIYAPLAWAANQCEPVRIFVTWYVCGVWQWDPPYPAF